MLKYMSNQYKYKIPLMKKLYIFALFISCFLMTSIVSAASDSDDGMKTVESHSKHPPHNHHDTDHLKHIRSHWERKRKKTT